MTLAFLALAVYCGMSLATFALYAFDKNGAARGGRRIPERTLHLCELLGGWPGALAGQQLLRHKSTKLSYRLVLWTIIALHAAGWFAYIRWVRA